MKDKHDIGTIDMFEQDSIQSVIDSTLQGIDSVLPCKAASDTSYHQLAPEQAVIGKEQLLRNAIQTPDGTVLESKHRHDYVAHVDKITGKTYFVDGGLDYIRRSAHNDQINLSLWLDMPHEVLREQVTWGNRGVDGKQPLAYLPIAQMSTEHIEAVIANVPNIYPAMLQVMIDELEWRNK